jgi:lipopolysaccharide/colanic/teichoic acid biosynthesis glycosyltransferase
MVTLTSRRATLLAVDLGIVAVATCLALLLRDNFEINFDKWLALGVCYLPISLVNAGVVFFSGGLDRGLWRHSSVSDYIHIVVLTVVVVLLSVGLGFAVNRLDGIPRSLPILQSILIIGSLVSARVIVRLWSDKKCISKFRTGTLADAPQTILVIGINTISDLFFRSVREFAPHCRIAGVLAVDSTFRGRTIQRHEVLGTVDHLHGILESLHVHGVAVDRIVVTVPQRSLSQPTVALLERVESSSDIIVDVLSERLGFDDAGQQCRNPRRDAGPLTPHHDPIRTAQNGYWKLKRVIDVFAALLLMALLAPIFPVIAVLVALDVGFPLIFWQQRPGLRGCPFRLYKFRTMRASHDMHFNRIKDESRLSFVGRCLRKLRFDELPQLYNILIGDMSLVGPRPLLPHDQPPNFGSRLSVRPGLTGWAQVNGGRIISATDKATLDIWYVNKASLLLDVQIIFRTVKMVLLGDRINAGAVCQARQELEESIVG